jgi:hypothetical protein
MKHVCPPSPPPLRAWLSRRRQQRTVWPVRVPDSPSWPARDRLPAHAAPTPDTRDPSPPPPGRHGAVTLQPDLWPPTLPGQVPPRPGRHGTLTPTWTFFFPLTPCRCPSGHTVQLYGCRLSLVIPCSLDRFRINPLMLLCSLSSSTVLQSPF